MAVHCLVHQWVTRVIRTLLLGGVLFSSTLPAISEAQFTTVIKPDGTLGTTVTQAGNVYHIDGGTIKGSNQFHSLNRLSVGTGDIASFNGPGGIANILSRVTGGQSSAIDGTLRSMIPGANPFLLNPSGVPLGSNASLKVDGSFHVSTADYLRFADGAKFYANLAQESVLTVAAPKAFGFLGPHPASVAVRESSLEVPAGKTLSVSGGDIEITGGPSGVLAAPGGRIHLVSVASPGEVPLDLSEFKLNTFERLGQVTLSDLALLDASSAGGGTIVIRGGRLLVDGSFMFADTLGDVDDATLGIDLRIAEDLTLTNGAFISSQTVGAGRAGDIGLQAGRLTLLDGSQISSSTLGGGRGGDLTVVATDAISIAGIARLGFQSGLFSYPEKDSSANAGRVFISAPALSTEDGGIIATNTAGAGSAGSIDVQVGKSTLTEGAQIFSGTGTVDIPGGPPTGGLGQGGAQISASTRGAV